jgi:hypothetical protein
MQPEVAPPLRAPAASFEGWSRHLKVPPTGRPYGNSCHRRLTSAACPGAVRFVTFCVGSAVAGSDGLPAGPRFLDCPPRGRTPSPSEPAGVSEQRTWRTLRPARASSCSPSTIECAADVDLAGSKSPTRSRGTSVRVSLAPDCPRCARSVPDSRGTRLAGTWERRACFGPRSETGWRADTASANSASTLVPRADLPGPQDSE